MDDLKAVIDEFETEPNDDWMVEDWGKWYDLFIPALRYEIKRIEER